MELKSKMENPRNEFILFEEDKLCVTHDMSSEPRVPKPSPYALREGQFLAPLPRMPLTPGKLRGRGMRASSSDTDTDTRLEDLFQSVVQLRGMYRLPLQPQ